MVQDARTIVRSCFETVFCFGALRNNPTEFQDKFEKHGVYSKRVFADSLLKGKIDPEVAKILSAFMESSPGEKGRNLNWQEVAQRAGLCDVYNVYYRGISGDAAHPSPTALKRYYKIDGSNVELLFGPTALDEKDIEETLIASCVACWYLVAWQAEDINHPEINKNLHLCFEELKRLNEARASYPLPFVYAK